MVGPALAPNAIDVAPHPRAWPRCAGDTALLNIAVLVERISALPTPWSARAAISNPSEGAVPHTAEPAVNTTSPAIQIGERPIMSDRRPNVSSSAPITTRYPMTIHSSVPVTGALNARPIDGKPMLTIE